VLFAVRKQASPLIGAGAVNYTIFSVGDLERFVEDAVAAPPGRPARLEVFGARLNADLRHRAHDQVNVNVTSFYSTNETSPIAVMNDDNVGDLCDGVEVRIVDATGREAPHGEAGTIQVRGVTSVDGYWNDSVMTAACFFDGWYQTSDTGLMPAPGKVVVLGRADGMLNIGGVKIPPDPIEAEVKAIEGVSDAVVMTVTSPNDVDALVVAVETAGRPTPPGLERRVGTIINRYVGVFTVMPWPAFPRTDSGKPKRQELEDAFRRV
jgi:acyl-coenzyme A synthetase/AMP-(fatty) acid ligase